MRYFDCELGECFLCSGEMAGGENVENVSSALCQYEQPQVTKLADVFFHVFFFFFFDSSSY